MHITITQLRSNLYKMIDQVIQTGKPIELQRKGVTVKIILEKPKNDLSKLEKYPDVMVGKPESFVHINWQTE
jgi:hypothetical protein